MSKTSAKKQTGAKRAGRAQQPRSQQRQSARKGNKEQAGAQAVPSQKAIQSDNADKSAASAAAKAAAILPDAEKRIINALPYAVIVAGEEGRILYVNPAAELFFQMSSNVMLRRDLEQIIGFSSPVLALVEQVREKGGSVNEYAVELAMPRLDEPRRVDLHVCQLPDISDTDASNAGDIVMIVLQERNMAQMIERQITHQGAVKSVTALTAMLAHEIKNPLSGIKGAAQLLEADLSDQDRELTQLICTETDRICSILDRMDMFGEDPRAEFRPQNIHAILNHVIQVATSGFAQHIRFKKIYDPSLPAVWGNRNKLIQIYLNLIKNAAEAIGPDRSDGVIAVYTRFRPGVRMTVPGANSRVSLPINISIEDNGPGISPELRPHIFDPFVTTKSSGSGLGLALTAKLINDHGGILDCDSYPGRTIFTTMLPKADVDISMAEAVD